MKTLEDLKKVREKALEQMKIREGKFSARVVVAMGTCGIAAGAREVMTSLLEDLAERGLTEVTVSQTGCKGLCDREPMVEVVTPDSGAVTYGGVTPQIMRRIVAEHIVNGQVVREYALGAK